MEDASEASPFSAFAMPKRSAVEIYRERQRRAAQVRRRMVGYVGAGAVGAMCGSSAGAADGRLEAVFPALAGAAAGTFIGIASGFVLGGICYAVMIMMNARGRPNLETELARRDPLEGLQAMFFVWSLIGVAIGAASGAALGVQAANPAVKMQPLLRTVMIASILVESFAAGLWRLRLRSAAKPALELDPPPNPSV